MEQILKLTHSRPSTYLFKKKKSNRTYNPALHTTYICCMTNIYKEKSAYINPDQLLL